MTFDEWFARHAYREIYRDVAQDAWGAGIASLLPRIERQTEDLAEATKTLRLLFGLVRELRAEIVAERSRNEPP